MPIVIEEMTGEIVPPRRPDEDAEGPDPRPVAEAELRRRVRRVLAREHRHAERLCDG